MINYFHFIFSTLNYFHFTFSMLNYFHFTFSMLNKFLPSTVYVKPIFDSHVLRYTNVHCISFLNEASRSPILFKQEIFVSPTAVDIVEFVCRNSLACTTSACVICSTVDAIVRLYPISATSRRVVMEASASWTDRRITRASASRVSLDLGLKNS